MVLDWNLDLHIIGDWALLTFLPLLVSLETTSRLYLKEAGQAPNKGLTTFVCCSRAESIGRKLFLSAPNITQPLTHNWLSQSSTISNPTKEN